MPQTPEAHWRPPSYKLPSPTLSPTPVIMTQCHRRIITAPWDPLRCSKSIYPPSWNLTIHLSITHPLSTPPSLPPSLPPCACRSPSPTYPHSPTYSFSTYTSANHRHPPTHSRPHPPSTHKLTSAYPPSHPSVHFCTKAPVD